MTERTPEQAALMAVIEAYAEAKSSYQYACLEGCWDDEANAEADLATAFAAMEATVCAPKVEVVWPDPVGMTHRGQLETIKDGYAYIYPVTESSSFCRLYTREQVEVLLAQQTPHMPVCATCNDHGAVGHILTAEPCPDCSVLNPAAQQKGKP